VNSMLRMTPGLLALAGWFGRGAGRGLEIIMKEDFTKGVIKEDQLVRLVDTRSSSWIRPLRRTRSITIRVSPSSRSAWKDSRSGMTISRRSAPLRHLRIHEVAGGLPPQTYQRDKVRQPSYHFRERIGLDPLAKGIENVEEVVRVERQDRSVPVL